MAVYNLLRFASMRCAPFSPYLVENDAPFWKLLEYGWLRRIEKPYGRCAYQITEIGKKAYEVVEDIRYHIHCGC